MRILMLLPLFDPEPIFKGLVFAKELIKRGHVVEVLTGFPNYPEGKLYPGYKIKILQRETVEGISIIRVPLYPSHNNSAIQRILSYASFALSAALLGPWLVKPADVMYVYHPPLTVSFPAIMIKFFRRIPFVYDMQDLWPDALRATGMLNNRILLMLVNIGCRLVYRIADRIVVLSPGFKKELQERGVSEKKVDVIYNWCDERQIKTLEQEKAEEQEPLLAGRFNIVFAGTMGKAQALDAALEAAAMISKRAPKAQFVFVGGGVDRERLEKITGEKQLQNVLFLPRRPIEEIGFLLSVADVLFVHLKNDPLFEITIPSKTQACLAAGRPILIAVRGDAAELVKKAGAGLVCMPEDPKSIADAVEVLACMPREELEAMGARGKKYYEQELSLSIGARQFEGIFKKAAGCCETIV